MARAMRISVPDVDLIDLKERLKKTRMPDQLKGTTWEYGMDGKYLAKLIDYWQHEFDWRKQVLPCAGPPAAPPAACLAESINQRHHIGELHCCYLACLSLSHDVPVAQRRRA